MVGEMKYDNSTKLNATRHQYMCYTYRQGLEEISKVQNELKQLAKRLQYYDDDVMEGKEDGTVKFEVCSVV